MLKGTEMQLNRSELNVILAALNDREGVLATEYELAFRAKSYALADAFVEEMKELRRIAEVVSLENQTAN
jgi:hypothetical protein